MPRLCKQLIDFVGPLIPLAFVGAIIKIPTRDSTLIVSIDAGIEFRGILILGYNFGH